MTAIASAQSKWTLTTADFQARQVDIAGIDDNGALVSDGPSAAPRRVKWDDLLLLSRSVDAKPAAARFTLFLVGGDQLRGAPVKLEGETLHWKASAVGDMAIPLRQVSGMSKAGQSLPAGAARTTEDVVVLANGDSVRGIVADVGASEITVNAGGTPTPVPLDSVVTLMLASTAPPAGGGERALRVRLADDSVVTANAVRTVAERLALALPGGGGAREVPFSSVASIEQINGPVSWLSSRQPSETLHTPFLQTVRPPRMDRNVSGNPIRFADRVYARGIGVAPYSKITWPLDGAYGTFRTQYAIDGGGAYADVAVRVLLDGKVVHERKSFTAGELSPVVLIPLGSAKSLTLEVDFGGNYNVQDRFNWIEPALVKGNPTPPATRPK